MVLIWETIHHGVPIETARIFQAAALGFQSGAPRCQDHRGMAMQAGTRLWFPGDVFGMFLMVGHVGMSATATGLKEHPSIKQELSAQPRPGNCKCLVQNATRSRRKRWEPPPVGALARMVCRSGSVSGPTTVCTTPDSLQLPGVSESLHSTW